MRILIATLLTACSAFAQQASVNTQGTDTRNWTTLWTDKGYVTIERRTTPVDSIIVTDQNGKVLIDTYIQKLYVPVTGR